MAAALLLIKVLLLSILVDGVTTQRCRFGEGCEFPCHCKNDAACDAETGDCTQGCDDGRNLSSPMFDSGEWYGPGCQIGNVAYGKQAHQRNIWDNNDYKAGPQNAVDGDTNQYFFGNDNTKCAVINPAPLWWQVDLGDIHLIYNITIYYRKNCCQDRIYGISIWIGNTSSLDDNDQYIDDSSQYTECSYTESGDEDQDRNTAIITKQCSHPILGQYVTFYNLRTISFMDICEAYVWGFKVSRDCPDGFWGPGCLERCQCKTACNYVTQSCTTRCRSGWIGKTCQYELPSLRAVKLHVENKTTTSIYTNFLQVLNPPNHMKQASYYVIQYRVFGDTDWIQFTNVSYSHQDETITVIVDNLEPGTNYDLQVLPVYIDGTNHLQGEATSQITVQTEGTTKTETTETKSGLIGGIAAAVIVILLLLTLIALIVWKKHKKADPKENVQKRLPFLPSHSEVQQSNERNKELGKGGYETINDDGLKDLSEMSQRNKVRMPEYRDNFIRKTGGRRNEACDVELEVTIQEESPYESIIGKTTYNIPVHELAQYITFTRNQLDGFKHEYENLPQGAVAPWLVGDKKENRSKNRFKNFRAYDHSRIVLTMPGDKKATDYINANFIKRYGCASKQYIAAQGPSDWTVNDMWRMIIQEKVKTIVMLVNVKEGEKVKSARYWPESGQHVYGDVSVELNSEKKFADFVIHNLRCTTKGVSRIVHHLQFTSWPDQGIPTPSILLQFLREVHKTEQSASNPLLVHCSEGIGCTGAFIAIDYLLEQAKREKIVNIFDCVARMRADRYNMVQTQMLYEFVYETVLEAMRSEHTAIPCNIFTDTFFQMCQEDLNTHRTELQEQFEILETMRMCSPNSNQDANNYTKLNRKTRNATGGKTESYELKKLKGLDDINTVFINSYQTKNAYIVTKSPLPDCMKGMWQLIWDYKCHNIVSLNKVGHIEYWPSKGKRMTFGILTVDLVKYEVGSEFTTRQFLLTHTNKDSHTVQQIHAEWEETASVPCSPSHLLNILDKVDEWSKYTGEGPVLVDCGDGVLHSGLMVAAMYLMDKMHLDQEVDAFHTVKYIRISQPQFIVDEDQYIFLHHLAQHYMEMNDIYANIK